MVNFSLHTSIHRVTCDRKFDSSTARHRTLHPVFLSGHAIWKTRKYRKATLTSDNATLYEFYPPDLFSIKHPSKGSSGRTISREVAVRDSSVSKLDVCHIATFYFSHLYPGSKKGRREVEERSGS